MTTTNRIETEGFSPFYPDRPVPVEFFRGRKQQIEHILQRGVGQVARGKAMTLFVEGEYGIGKSSIAAFTQRVAERDYGLHGIYASLAGATTSTVSRRRSLPPPCNRAPSCRRAAKRFATG